MLAVLHNQQAVTISSNFQHLFHKNEPMNLTATGNLRRATYQNLCVYIYVRENESQQLDDHTVKLLQ